MRKALAKLCGVFEPLTTIRGLLAILTLVSILNGVAVLYQMRLIRKYTESVAVDVNDQKNQIDLLENEMRAVKEDVAVIKEDVAAIKEDVSTLAIELPK